MGQISEILGDRVYLGANIVVYSGEGFPQFVEQVTRIAESLDRGEIHAIRIRLPDAIHLATAILQKCTSVVTNDLRWNSFPDCRVIQIAELK